MKKYITTCCLLCCINAFSQVGNTDFAVSPKLQFNGKNLEGWYSFLPSKGKNNDVDNVFAVENGLLHISGKEFGYICTDNAFKDFMMVVEFKWGEKKWPPRDADTVRRDNGILFFVPYGKDTVWPRSVECQIQEGDVGDFWMVDSTTIVVDGVRTRPGNFIRNKKSADGELPHGQWNTVTVLVRQNKITYWVNHREVNKGELPVGADGKPLAEGKIIIQSEGAEIFYRKIEIGEVLD